MVCTEEETMSRMDKRNSKLNQNQSGTVMYTTIVVE